MAGGGGRVNWYSLVSHLYHRDGDEERGRGRAVFIAGELSYYSVLIVITLSVCVCVSLCVHAFVRSFLPLL